MRRFWLLLLLPLALALVWRRARFRHGPCSTGWAWLLDNPVRHALWPPWSLIRRAGIERGHRVLEVGPGIGYYTVPMARAVAPAGRVVCVDLQPGMVAKLSRRLAAAHAANVDLILGDATRLPFRPAVFDRSVLVTVLGEVPNRRVALEEQARVLRPGALLAVGEQLPDPDYLPPRTVASLGTDAGLWVSSVSSWPLGHVTLLTPVA